MLFLGWHVVTGIVFELPDVNDIGCNNNTVQCQFKMLTIRLELNKSAVFGLACCDWYCI